MMFVVPDFFGSAVCSRIKRAMDRGYSSRAEICADGYHVDETARRAFDVAIEDDVVAEVQHAIDATRLPVARFFDMQLVAEEGPGFLRYRSGDFYRIHCDMLPGWEDEFPRRVSIVVFLTTAGADCEGGSLRLYGSADDRSRAATLEIAPAAGMLVAFPSTISHEVLPVTAGVRDVVVDWFY